MLHQSKKEQDASNELSDIVNRGAAEIYLITGPARSGTTATEKFLLNLKIHAQLNEPVSNNDEGIYEPNSKSAIVDKIHELHAQGIKKPRIVIKHTSRYIVAGEMEYWKNICSHIVLLVRNPALTMESSLNLKMNAFDRRDMHESIKLEKLLDEGEAAPVGKRRDHWQNYVSKSQSQRDYSQLKDVFAFNSMRHDKLWDNKPAMMNTLKRCVSNIRQELGEEKVRHLFKNSFCKSEKNFWETLNNPEVKASVEFIPDFLIDELTRYSLSSWFSLREHYAALANNKTTPYTVVDFSDIQLNPKGVIKELSKRMDIPLRDEHEALPGFYLTSPDKIWHDRKQYEQVMQNDDILPPSKKPITLEQFPHFVRRNMQDAMQLYATMSKDRNRIAVSVEPHVDYYEKKLPCGKVFAELDPITTYVQSKNAKQRHMLQDESPEYASYFSMIDEINSAARHSRKKPGTLTR